MSASLRALRSASRSQSVPLLVSSLLRSSSQLPFSSQRWWMCDAGVRVDLSVFCPTLERRRLFCSTLRRGSAAPCALRRHTGQQHCLLYLKGHSRAPGRRSAALPQLCALLRGHAAAAAAAAAGCPNSQTLLILIRKAAAADRKETQSGKKKEIHCSSDAKWYW